MCEVACRNDVVTQTVPVIEQQDVFGVQVVQCQVRLSIGLCFHPGLTWLALALVDVAVVGCGGAVDEKNGS